MIDTYLSNYRLEIEDHSSWTWMVKNDDAIRTPGIDERCNVEYIQAFLDKHLKNVRVTKAELNNTGSYEGYAAMWNCPNGEAGTITIDDLPEFCSVEVERQTNSGFDRILVWVPTVWNGRFFSENGASLRTNMMWEFAVYIDKGNTQSMNHVIGIRNGFAVSATDGGVRHPSLISWAYDPETGELDEEMLRNFDWPAGHYNAVIGKLVTEALTGEKPAYSYANGESGGGRNCMQIALNTPQDYDGFAIWSPAFCWAQNLCLPIWVNAVMRSLGDYLPYEKLEAFRDAAIAKYGGLEQYQQLKDRPTFDARECIGTKTDRGEITELDAKVMNLVWRGPEDEDGNIIVPGWRPGAKFWGAMGFSYGNPESDDDPDLLPFMVGEVINTWCFKDPEWDWNTVTLDNFPAFYKEAYSRLLSIGVTDDGADLTKLAKCGAKMILAAGTEDDCVNPDVTLGFYKRVNQIVGGGDMDKTRESCRFFLFPGMNHNRLDFLGTAPSLPDFVAPLMIWVEQGIAPETLHGIHVDADSGEVSFDSTISVY
ncbi:MAG: tannase/feruloyl esterase family alpha/beta hydrolase [Coriobacteriaceae bacterium]|nr:tannase/feruloyl esterase family alpha/beta hydrolase [Coriobacteriaceae bacterium]